MYIKYSQVTNFGGRTESREPQTAVLQTSFGFRR